MRVYKHPGIDSVKIGDRIIDTDYAEVTKAEFEQVSAFRHQGAPWLIPVSKVETDGESVKNGKQVEDGESSEKE